MEDEELFLKNREKYIKEFYRKYDPEEAYNDFIECGYGDWYSEKFDKYPKIEKKCKDFFIKNKLTTEDIIYNSPLGKEFNDLFFKLYKKKQKKADYFPY